MAVKYPGLQEFILGNFQYYKIEDIYRVAKNKFNYKNTLTNFKKYVYKTIQRNKIKNDKIKQRVVNINDKQFNIEKDFLTILEQKSINLIELCDQLNAPPKVIHELINSYRRKGYEIFINNNIIKLSNDLIFNPERIIKPLSDDTEIIFGVASDLHLGSNHVQITALNEFANECKKEGVKSILCAGDIFSGYKVYPGHELDVYAYTVDEQIESAVINIPTGLDWYMLGGNHDYSFIKRGGHNSLLALEALRKDIKYVGYDEADIPLLDGVEAKLWHPSGGIPYSVSYRLQKGVEQLAYAELQSIVKGSKDKPTTRFVFGGHLHIQMQAMFGSVFGAQVGCFEGTTNYLKRKGLVPAIGAYIIKACLNKDGLLKNFDAKFYMYPEIENDWMNYNHNIKNEVKIQKPILKK